MELQKKQKISAPSVALDAPCMYQYALASRAGVTGTIPAWKFPRQEIAFVGQSRVPYPHTISARWAT